MRFSAAHHKQCLNIMGGVDEKWPGLLNFGMCGQNNRVASKLSIREPRQLNGFKSLF